MNGIKIFTVFVWVFLAYASPCAASGVDAANAGMKAYKNGDKKKAEILFKSALNSNELSKENYCSVNNQLCRLLGSESRYKEAVDCYGETLYLAPDNPAARLGRGRLYQDMGQHEKALEDLSRYGELAPRDPKGHVYLGLAFRALKNYDRAISELSHAVWLRPGDGTIYIHRGNTYLAAGNYNLALADFKKAQGIDPENPYAFQAMAWFYAGCPNHDFRDGAKAIQWARQAVKLKKSPDPLFPATLAAAYAESGMTGHAVLAQKEAIALAEEKRESAGVSTAELYRRLALYETGASYSDQ